MIQLSYLLLKRVKKLRLTNFVSAAVILIYHLLLSVSMEYYHYY